MLEALLVGFAGLSTPSLPQGEGNGEETVHMGRAFFFEADVEAGRRLGWADPEATAEEVLGAVEVALQARLRNTGRFVEAQVAREEGPRFSVTFVGRMAESMERFLAAGFTNPGRLALGLVAEEEGLAAEGIDLSDERARLERWREAHPEADLRGFRALPREEGGPHPKLSWRPRRTGEDPAEEAAPLPLLADRVRLLRRAEMERAVRPVEMEGEVDGAAGYGLSVDLAPEARAELDRFAERWSGRRVAWTANGEVVGTELFDGPLREPLLVPGPFSMDEVRAWILAVAGEPLPAPLRFTGFGKRPLPNVKRRTEEDRRQ